ncbi:MAG: phage holin family protein [Saprospiraceae bacterium]|nr:phage holin family protein [Saprospiraceae bacterium]
MENQQDFREDLGKMTYYLQSYLKHNSQLVKLELSEVIGKLFGFGLAIIVAFVILGVGLTLLSVASLYFLANWLGSIGQACLWVGIFNTLLGSFIFMFKNKLFYSTCSPCDGQNIV